MDKVNFIKELCTISNNEDINLQNFERCMMFDNSVNLFYEALLNISNEYGAFGEISVAPVDFSQFTSPNGEFYFAFSKKVKTVIDCNKPIICSTGTCYIRKNDNAAGYIVNTNLNLG